MSEHKEPTSERVFTWARFVTPIIVSLLTGAFGVLIATKVMEAKIVFLEAEQGKQAVRLDALEKREIDNVERFTRLETKLDFILESLKNLNAR